MSEFKPTNKLRFVNRQCQSNVDSKGEMLPDGIVRYTTTKILQQWWEAPTYDGFTAGEWRDVPLVNEEVKE